MTIATAVIPVSPVHWQTGVYEEAIESVRRQTVATDFIVIHDEKGKGAAWARNKGTSQVKTDFVIWLDADDLLMPTFVEETIKKYRRGTFVYSNWQVNDKIAIPPAQLDPFGIGQQHIITTLMPTCAWRDAGKFDESLAMLEDEDFYRRLAAYGWRGIHCNQVLVNYRRRLGNSGVNQDSHDPDVVKRRVKKLEALFNQRYGKYRMIFELAKSKRQTPTIQAVGEKHENDVLCEALYVPMTQAGRVTGRRYPKTGFNAPIWVDIDDALARPDLWRIIAGDPQKISPDPKRVVELAKRAIQMKQPTLTEVTVRFDDSVEESHHYIFNFNPDKPNYSAMSLDELREELAKINVNEIDVVSDMNASWQTRKKEIVVYLDKQ